ncbi:FtsX-like permease family protein [Actinacidiphila sp. bgisy160]|uniref:FtsX-like permease family protein n=1 Tax=Actinacidiphila sp. bgisy160 TaxID=3413796 RepID=UPI003D71A018
MPGFVFLRLRAHRLLLGAALLSVLLTTCAVAALAAFSSAVGDAGLRRALQEQSAARTLVEITADVDGKDPGAVDEAVRATATGAYDGLPASVTGVTRSGPYGLPAALRPRGAPRTADPDLTVLSTLDRAQVTMTEGSFPGTPAAGEPVPVALPEAAAEALKVRAGQLITLADRLHHGTLRVRVTGTYRPVDAYSLYWRLDPLGGRGVRTLSFTTYGPMLTGPGAFGPGGVPAVEMEWQTHGDFAAMTTARADDVSGSVQRTVQRLEALPAANSVVADSELPLLFGELRGTLLVSRSTLLISVLQLMLLAALSLLLVAGLLAEERSGETAQLRARGGSRAQMTGFAAAEALLLTVPAVVLAPLLSGPLVRLLAGHGALARAGVRLEPSPVTAWWVAALTALACALAVVVPVLRRSGTYAQEYSARRRRRALPAAAQAGADAGLVLVAALAFWQLSRREAGSGALSTDTSGRLGLDPVLVGAPALCLLAGAVLALRLLPLAARLGERRAAKARGLPASLVGWQLARRPGRGAGPALLLVFAVSISMFAIGENSTWTRSQDDQADFAVGADLRVSGSATPAFGQGGIYDDVPGIAAVTPAARDTVSLPRDRDATVVAVDTTAAAQVLRLRDDLSTESLTDLMRPLRADGETAARGAGFVLPDGTDRLRLTVRLRSLGAEDRTITGTVTDQLYVTVTDRYGVPYTLPLGEVRADGEQHVLEADFAAVTGRARGAGPAGPLRMTGLRAEYRVPRRNERHSLTVTRVHAMTADGLRDVPSPTTTAWSARTQIDNPDFPEAPGLGYRPSDAGKPRSAADTPLTVRYDTGEEPFQKDAPGGADGASLTLRAGPPRPPTVLPAVVTDDFLSAVDARPGSTVPVELAGTRLSLRVTGSVHALPTTGPDGSSGTGGGAVLLDLASLDRALVLQDQRPLEPTEWWLAAGPAGAPRVAAALRARGDAATIVVRDEARAELRRDPLGAGPLSALPAAVVAAAVLAAVGFAVAAAGAVRERSEEFALLRALGTPRGSLARVIAAEQGLLVLTAVGVGALLGGLLTRSIVPLIVLTARADSPVPAVRVQLPAVPLLELLTAVAVLPLLAVAVAALRTADPVRALRRQGGE